MRAFSPQKGRGDGRKPTQNKGLAYCRTVQAMAPRDPGQRRFGGGAALGSLCHFSFAIALYP
jgi:hypothetical protein